MKKIEPNSEEQTSLRARQAGLRRIPRRHLLKPGEVTLADCKVRVTMYLDADVLEHFKQRAAAPNMAPYQTQINSELRSIVDRDRHHRSEKAPDHSTLVADEKFIAAVADRVKGLHIKRSARGSAAKTRRGAKNP
jgi:uncharacterized protein (DUF4415 family)